MMKTGQVLLVCWCIPLKEETAALAGERSFAATWAMGWREEHPPRPLFFAHFRQISQIFLWFSIDGAGRDRGAEEELDREW